jgi:hypothetical protein
MPALSAGAVCATALLMLNRPTVQAHTAKAEKKLDRVNSRWGDDFTLHSLSMFCGVGQHRIGAHHLQIHIYPVALSIQDTCQEK